MRFTATNIRERIDRLLQTPTGLARLAGLAGVVLTLVGLALWMLFIFTFFSPGERFGGPDLLGEVAVANALFALLAFLGILLSGRRRRLSALVLLLAFVGSFVAGFGWYLLLLPPPLPLVGAGGLLYLVSAAAMLAAVPVESSQREDGD